MASPSRIAATESLDLIEHCAIDPAVGDAGFGRPTRGGRSAPGSPGAVTDGVALQKVVCYVSGVSNSTA